MTRTSIRRDYFWSQRGTNQLVYSRGILRANGPNASVVLRLARTSRRPIGRISQSWLQIQSPSISWHTALDWVIL